MVRLMQHFVKNKKAMTMIEALLVVALFSTLSLTIFQAFSNGLRIWDYGTASFKEEDVSIFLDKLSLDLRNSLLFSRIPFKGNPKSLECASLLMLKADPKSSEKRLYARQIGKVKYFFDKNKGKIFRIQANYGQALKSRYQDSKVLVNQVADLTFRYFYKEGEDLLIALKAEDDLPTMIEVSVQYQGNGDVRRITKRIDIPVGLQ